MRTGRPDPLDSVNLLDLVPFRLAEWRDADGQVVILRPVAHRGSGLRRRLVWATTPRRLRLDALGSFAWRRIDGSSSVRDVARAVRDAFGDRAEPVEERLGSFVRLLRRECLVGYRGYDSPPRTPASDADGR